MPPPKKTTTGKGLGWAHQQQRRRLLARHHDGAPCPCLELGDCGAGCPCRVAGYGLPMYRDPERNPDGMPLEADHTLARSQGGTSADRLLLATCNRSRGDGTRVGFTTTRPTWWTRTWFDLPASPPQRLVVLLCGPAGAGKTTAARESGLVVYDRDDPKWQGEKDFAAALSDIAHDSTARAVVIRSAPTSVGRKKAAALVRATHTFLVLADQRELGHRVARRSQGNRQAALASIGAWFDRFDRDDDVPDFPGWPAVFDAAEALSPAR